MKLWKGATFVFMFCGALLSLHLTRNIMVTTGPARLQPRIALLSSSSPSPSPSSPSPSSTPSSSPSPSPSSSLPSPSPPPSPPSPSPSTQSSSPSSSPSSSSSSPSSPPSSSSRMKAGLHRTVRTVDTISSLLSQYSPNSKMKLWKGGTFVFMFCVSHLLQSFTEGELKKVIGTLVDRSRKRRGRSSREEESQESSSQRTTGAKRGRRRRRRRLKPCSLREVEVTVGELGLGYDSDETLLFRYCSGKCTARRRNYDITLEHMRRTGLIKKGRRDKVRYSPCCRPIAYEKDISFLDNNSRYHTVQEVLARECGCA